MKLNQGQLYTNDNCIGCNRCIAVCPIVGANVAGKSDGDTYIRVDNRKCLHCGTCLAACQHNARVNEDDTETFLEDLKRGEAVSVLVDPAFFMVCADRAHQILGYLKSLGVHTFYDVGYGGDIATWANVMYLDEHPGEGVVSPHCAAVVNYIKKYSKALQEKLIPVQPPFLCLATYVRKYLHNTDKLAFLGCCAAKSEEIALPENQGLVQYNITFHKLWNKIRLLDLSGYDAQVELGDCGLGKLYGVPNGLTLNMSFFCGEQKNIREVHGSRRVNEYLRELDKRCRDGKELPYLADLLNCEHGCLTGLANTMFGGMDDDVIFRVNETRTKIAEQQNPFLMRIPVEERRKRLCERFQHLDLEDFKLGRLAQEEYVGHKPMYKARLDAVFRSMHKEDPASRMIDCCSCGYSSCLEMATAIAKGYNTVENCVRYLKDENERLSLIDIRSGIPNMNAFLQHCKKIIESERAPGYTAISFSINNYRLVNQEYGFLRGDDILKEYCHILSEFTASDELIAVVGDNNFVGLIRNEHVEQILGALEKISLHTVQEELNLSAQVAVYELNGSEIAPSMILDKLSTTLNLLHKTPNRFRLDFEEQFQTRAAEQEKIMLAIEPAIAALEFEPFFQPKVDMRTRKLAGAEALIRWRKDGSLVSPGAFLPIAEKTGLVKKLDFYILEETCRRLKEWKEKGLELVPVSVNFSKKHFAENTVADRIHEIINRWGISPEYIEVEFTETAYLDDGQKLISSIDKLHEYGIRSSMDDFGVGYSSLSMLQNMSFDTLKLDRSFLTSGDYEKERCRTVISHIICMAKDLKMSTVSEGIETERELAYMKSLGCDMAQGYLFDKPLPHDLFEKRLEAQYYPE